MLTTNEGFIAEDPLVRVSVNYVLACAVIYCKSIGLEYCAPYLLRSRIFRALIAITASYYPGEYIRKAKSSAHPTPLMRFIKQESDEGNMRTYTGRLYSVIHGAAEKADMNEGHLGDTKRCSGLADAGLSRRHNPAVELQVTGEIRGGR